MSDNHDANLIQRALTSFGYLYDDEEADRIMIALARDALETMQHRIEVMRDALDEIQRHCDEGPGGDSPPDRDGRWAARIASDALNKAFP